MKQINDQYEQDSFECELMHIRSEQQDEEQYLFI